MRSCGSDQAGANVVEAHSSHFKSLQSQDLDEARSLVAGVFNDHQLRCAERRVGLNYRHRYTVAGSLGFSVIGYGASVQIQTRELESFYLLQLPLAGEDRQVNRGASFHSKAGGATVHGPNDRLTMNWSADCHKLAIRIDRDALERYASCLSDRPLNVPIQFNHEVDTRQGGGLALKLAAGQMFRNLCKQPDLFKLPMVCSQFEQMLFLNLLTLQPQVMASGRLQPPMDVLPKTIKLAEDYMRAHLDEDITMETLVHLTGASMRSLYEGFRKHRSESPMRYLRHLRLEKVREELLSPTRKANITDVAQQWGFVELGRFASLYRERYGELPSETLRRVQ